MTELQLAQSVALEAKATISRAQPPGVRAAGLRFISMVGGDNVRSALTRMLRNPAD